MFLPQATGLAGLLNSSSFPQSLEFDRTRGWLSLKCRALKAVREEESKSNPWQVREYWNREKEGEYWQGK